MAPTIIMATDWFHTFGAAAGVDRPVSFGNGAFGAWVRDVVEAEAEAADCLAHSTTDPLLDGEETVDGATA